MSRARTGKRGGCPVCGKPATAGARPFCSAACRDTDLSRWLEGAYRIPVDETDLPAGEEEEG